MDNGPTWAAKLAQTIDHTLLKATATEQHIATLCAEAVQYGFATVCIHPVYVPLAAKWLSDTEVGVCTVVGFPLGTNTTGVKSFEAGAALADGADEVDMVLAVHALKNKRFDQVRSDIAAVVTAAECAPVKVILETCYLSKAEIQRACELAVDAGASFVKTSTGFGSGGATVEHVALMRQTVGEHIGVKASGGIRDGQTALAMIQAGANRLGCSAGVAIVSGLTPDGGPSEY